MHEIIVGLWVKNNTGYSNYRDEMTPILVNEYGGGFRYDFEVSKVLKNEENRPINRVFAIFFKDASNMDKFFKDSRYIEIKNKYFESSVEHTTIISEYDR
ncbi:MAG: DUF1330 domain-containing protein [Bacteriovoracaceae bacterium]|nr:DUF1330 domain-containing protein [Bacteriovoracaceae bacterium]